MTDTDNEVVLIVRLAACTKAGLVVGKVAFEGICVGWEGEVLTRR